MVIGHQCCICDTFVCTAVLHDLKTQLYIIDVA